ncbi:MAG: glycosyltransferase family 39 protein [Anaerolineae bacterium]|nr:glycosyltransferase family 39 protein [Anaerolineae bacterium]
MSVLNSLANASRANRMATAGLSQGGTTRWWLSLGVGLAMLSAVLLPLPLLASQRFHHDEALYATWALQIASGKNPLLTQIPIDKPPLFLYVVAGFLGWLGPTETAARLPSLLATCLTVGLVFWLGKKMYGYGVGLLAAWLVALSPFTIMFAPTAFTDPMLVTLVLAGCLAAVHGRTVWAGLFLGLAIATKQQGVFFVPLAFALLILGVRSNAGDQGSNNAHYVWRNFLLATTLSLLPVFLWDLARNQSPGFWQLSVINYGGLETTTADFGERWQGFIHLLGYATASPILNTIFGAGLPLTLVSGAYQIMNHQNSSVPGRQRFEVYYDWILSLFTVTFLLVHSLLSFQVWDRYLLGLIPILALLLVRVLLLPWSILKHSWLDYQPQYLPTARLIVVLALIGLLTLTLAHPVQDAVNGRYPLGSNSRALSGIEQIVAYLQGQTNADTTLYHHWLGTHWRFYLWDYPYDLQYWLSPEYLASRAKPGHLIAFPAWRSDTEARLALAQAGLALRELARAYTPGGNPSIVLYQIVEVDGKEQESGKN